MAHTDAGAPRRVRARASIHDNPADDLDRLDPTRVMIWDVRDVAGRTKWWRLDGS